jgi:alpha,alpha-trehalose phosphorylase
MISHAASPTKPWRVREATLDLGLLAQADSLFALSNGHVGWRANLDEAEAKRTAWLVSEQLLRAGST